MEKGKAEEKLTLLKKRGVCGSPLNKAVLKVKELKKRMNNVDTMQLNKLFKSKFNACKGDLKTTFKIVIQLFNKEHCSNFPIHTYEKTLASCLKCFVQIKLRK